MSSVFTNQSDGQQQANQGATTHPSFEHAQYQHMNQPSTTQPGGFNNMRPPGMHHGMPPGQMPMQNPGMNPNQMPHQPAPQQMPNPQMGGLPHNPAAMQPQQPVLPMAPPASVQKLLDENNQFIQLLLDYQAKGKHQECAEYQRLLHRNLVYLATVADANNQNMQSSGAPPNIPLPPSNTSTPNMNGQTSG